MSVTEFLRMRRIGVLTSQTPRHTIIRHAGMSTRRHGDLSRGAMLPRRTRDASLCHCASSGSFVIEGRYTYKKDLGESSGKHFVSMDMRSHPVRLCRLDSEPASKVPIVDHRTPRAAFESRHPPFGFGAGNGSTCRVARRTLTSGRSQIRT